MHKICVYRSYRDLESGCIKLEMHDSTCTNLYTYACISTLTGLPCEA